MKSSKLRLAFILSIAVLSGCASNSNSQLTSNNLGVGNSAPKIALAFVADANFGKSLSRRDREKLTEAELRALNYGSVGIPFDWKGNSANTSGSVLAYQPFKVGKSRCRRFQHNVRSKIKDESVTGTACIREQGVWELID